MSSKSNRLLGKHIVFDMVCEIWKKWIKRFSKSEMKSGNAFFSSARHNYLCKNELFGDIFVFYASNRCKEKAGRHEKEVVFK